MGSLTLDPEALRRYLAQQARDIARRPITPQLSTDELEVVIERYGALAPRVAEILERELWEQEADVEHLAQQSYGYAVQHKSRERFLKLLVPEEATTSHTRDAVRASTDAELLALLEAVGGADEPRALTAGESER